MKLSDISIERPVLASMMSLLLILFGLVGLTRLPVRELPDIDPPIVNVQTVYPGASAAVIETQITEPLEDALSSVEGIKKLTSESREQVSSVTIEFDLSEDVDIAAQDVRDRVARVRGRLPSDIDEPIVSKQDADANPSIWVALYSERFSTLELTTIGENLFKDRLQTVPGVSSVILGGSKRFAIRIRLDSSKMAAHRVTVLDVQRALNEQSVELPSGRVESLQRELSIETKGQLKTPEEYNALVILRQGDELVRLSDIGFAEIGVEDERSVARYNREPAVGLGIIKQSKANIIDVAHGIKEELERIIPLLPEGINYNIAYDESIYVEKSIKEVWITLGLAFFLVVLVIFIFLHNFRATLIPAVTIPVSIIATFGVLHGFGYSINVITMLAFVLAIGLVVDDAIVVLENIHRHIEKGLAPHEAAYKGMKEIGFAVIATTVALVAVFLPMAFQTSDTGRLFIEFAVAISFSVIISTFVALTLAPMMCARFLKPHHENKKRGLLILFEEWVYRRRNGYIKMLRVVLRYTLVMILVCAAVVAGAVYFYQNLDSEFLPDEDKGRLFIIAIAPEGSTSEYTNRMVRKMEEIISARDDVQGFFSAVALSRGGPGQASQGLSFIRLKEQRESHVRDIVNGPGGLRGEFFMNVEGALVIPIIPKAIGRGFSQPFQLVLQHQDLNELNRIANEFSQTLRQEGYLINVRSSFELNKPELRVRINRDRAAVLGVSVKDISQVLQILFGGLDLAKVNLGGKEYDVIVQLERSSRLTPSALEDIYVRNAEGSLIQLIGLVDYETGGGPSAINHFNRLRSATIEGTPQNIPMGRAIERTEVLLKNLDEKGLRYDWNGEAADLQEAGSETLFVILMAILIIYMVLAAQFESLKDPLVILFTLPLSIFGALGSLWLLAWLDGMIVAAAGTDSFLSSWPRIPAMGINLFSQIGMIMLIGIVTKNGILLVDFANQEMKKGKSAVRAMIGAGKMRFRPILMTAFSTIAGILPIAIGFGAGAESRRPLGVAAVGGIALGTFLTLFVIPAVYVLFNPRKKTRPGKDPSAKQKQPVKAGLTVLLLLSVTATGCQPLVGKDYKRPQLTIPDGWSVYAKKPWKQATPRDDVDRGRWWMVYEDEQLNALQEQALAANYSLKSAVAKVERARALARISRSEFYPELDLNPDMMRSRTTKNSFNSTSAGTKSFASSSYNVPLDLSYEIDIWGRVKRGFESAQAEAEATRAELYAVRLIMAADVATHYFLLRELDREVDIIDEAIKLRQYAVDVVQDRVKGGLTSELDFNRARTELGKARTDRVDILRRRKEIETALAVLCGQLPGDFRVPKSPLKGDDVPEVPVLLPSELLERRPDIAQAERRVAAANARIGVAEAAFFPRVTLSASGGIRSVEFGNLFDWESRYWSVGPEVALPLFNGGRNTANLEASEAEYIETVEAYRQTVLEAIGQVETAMGNIRFYEEQTKVQFEVLTSSRQTAKLSIARYREGLVTFLEVIDAERSRLDAELQATQIISQRLIATVQLIKSLGGAW
ncbi:MAG: efflux transporter outer membrane subunit [Candidatus Omnitrophica bacterium]|nr:efflux transporter outer membrane subunit [Candidatus Omnitrophota bacterium]